MPSLANTGAYLDQLYQEKFGRAPDAAGKAYWQKEIDSGRMDAASVANAFDASDEAKQIKADKEEETRKFIEDTYKVELDREPDKAGAAYWAEQINSGNQTQEQVTQNIQASNEYKEINDEGGSGQNHQEWLEGVYQDVLKRDIGDEGKEYWMGDLAAGATREEVEANIKRSDEKWLGDVYEKELGRDLGDEGREYWMEDMRERGQTREDVLGNIKRSEEYQCAQSGGTWNGSTCTPKEDVIVCPTGQQLNSDGTGCVPFDPDPEECPAGTAWDGTQCRATGDEEMKQCPDGSVIPKSETCPVIEDDDPDPEVCPTGTRRNAAGNCEAIPGPTPDGEDDDDDSGTYMGDDPNKEVDDSGTRVGDWTGDDPSMGDLYDQKKKEYEDLFNGASLRDDEYQRLKSDYDDARREADSYINAQRDEETAKLRSGIAIGGFPGRRRGDLKSGATATSDRSRKRNQITAGPKVRDDRPYAARGIRGGYSTGSTFFDKEGNFRQ